MAPVVKHVPFDVYVHILQWLPVADDDDSSVKTLVTCTQTDSVLREAASLSKIWEPHYKGRYTECNHDGEERRKAYTGGDFRLMYILRRRLDHQALNILNTVLMERTGRHEHAQQLTRTLSNDVWNVLELETRRSPTEILQSLHGDNLNSVAIIPHAIPRRFWAAQLLGTITRSSAIKLWINLPNVPVKQDPVTFEIAFAYLSAFFGWRPTQVSAIFDTLGAECRVFLTEQGISFGPDEYNDAEALVKVAVGIRDFMRNQGFGPANSSFHQVHNHFPHGYLTSNRETIPLSLVYCFVCIARRLGICASPLDFPTRVLALVESPNPQVENIIMDVYTSDHHPILSLAEDIPSRIIEAGGILSMAAEYVTAASTASMLARSSRNILSSFHFPHVPTVPTQQLLAAMYTGVVVNLIFGGNPLMIQGLLRYIDDFPLDACAVLVEHLAPALDETSHERLMNGYEQWVTTEQAQLDSMMLRSQTTTVKFFVGMLFQHRSYNYIGCIDGWEPTCMATEDWIMRMGVDSLSRGRHQPFYKVITLDGSRRYVAEENIVEQPQATDRGCAEAFLCNNVGLDRYFEDFRMNERRMILVPSPELQHLYPDDMAMAERWLITGTNHQ